MKAFAIFVGLTVFLFAGLVGVSWGAERGNTCVRGMEPAKTVMVMGAPKVLQDNVVLVGDCSKSVEELDAAHIAATKRDTWNGPWMAWGLTCAYGTSGTGSCFGGAYWEDGE